jgi:hypothetical protein
VYPFEWASDTSNQAEVICRQILELSFCLSAATAIFRQVQELTGSRQSFGRLAADLSTTTSLSVS